LGFTGASEGQLELDIRGVYGAVGVIEIHTYGRTLVCHGAGEGFAVDEETEDIEQDAAADDDC